MTAKKIKSFLLVKIRVLESKNAALKETIENLRKKHYIYELQSQLRTVGIHITIKPSFDYKKGKTTYVANISMVNKPNRIIKSPKKSIYQDALTWAVNKGFKILNHAND